MIQDAAILTSKASCSCPKATETDPVPYTQLQNLNQFHLYGNLKMALQYLLLLFLVPWIPLVML